LAKELATYESSSSFHTFSPDSTFIILVEPTLYSVDPSEYVVTV